MSAHARPRVVIATTSRDKFGEISAILAGVPCDFVSLLDVPGWKEVDETGATLRDNAFLKARAAVHALGLPAISDDSGLEVDALGGEPGVRSARYAGEDVTYDDNNRLLLERMRGIPPEKRGARFVCVAALVTPGGREIAVEGEVRGEITEAPRGSNGFGYDPVFFVSELGATFGEADPAAKHRLSHRGRAFRAMRAILEVESANLAPGGEPAQGARPVDRRRPGT